MQEDSLPTELPGKPICQVRLAYKIIITYHRPGGVRASLVAQLVKNPPAMKETLAGFLGLEDLLEKG